MRASENCLGTHTYRNEVGLPEYYWITQILFEYFKLINLPSIKTIKAILA
jgi:hypothetical protein